MTALEIVMVSLVSAFVLIAIMVAIALHLFKRVLEKKITDYEVLNKYAPEGPIVFLGDSLTDFYPVQEFLHDDRIVNRGIANDKTEDVEKRIQDIIDLKPCAVFLQIGINNFVRGKKSTMPSEVVPKIIAIADKLKEICKDIKVVSLYPINNKKMKISKLYLRGTTNQKVLLSNQLLEKACRERGYEFIDVHSHLIDDSGRLKAAFTLEGLHLTLLGYETITNVLAPYVEAIK